MASRATRKHAAPAPVSNEDGVPAGMRQEEDAKGTALGHAAGGRSMAAVPEAAEPPEAYQLRKRPRTAAAGESMPDATVVACPRRTPCLDHAASLLPLQAYSLSACACNSLQPYLLYGVYPYVYMLG